MKQYIKYEKKNKDKHVELITSLYTIIDNLEDALKDEYVSVDTLNEQFDQLRLQTEELRNTVQFAVKKVK